MLKANYSFEAIGTQWSIETETKIPVELKNTIQRRIEAFDSTYSRFRKDSLVTKIAQKPGEYLFPKDTDKLLSFYSQLYAITNGKVTPLIGDMISRAGYDADYSLKPLTQKPIILWDDAVMWDGTTLKTNQPVTLDFGAAGKGYLIDIISDILNEHSVTEYVVDGSGDLKHKGTSMNKIGLEHPLDATKIIGAIDVQNRSFCASTSNRRAWGEGMHHIFDPDEMAPTRDIIATWVIADEAMIADGLATALFFTDPRTLREKYDYEYVRMHANGVLDYSAYFKDSLF